MVDIFSGNMVKRIIIDEVGMLRTDYLDLMNKRLQMIRGDTRPFGGIQMVTVGDFCQLEPIVSYNEQQHFYEQYSSPFCFTSSCWDLDTIELDKVYRQDDETSEDP